MAGKEVELADDSALIKAFNQAISNYKIMHGYNETPSLTKHNLISSTESQFSTLEIKSSIDSLDDGNNYDSNVTLEVGKSGDMRAEKENESINTEVPEVEAFGSIDIPFQDQSQTYSSLLDIDEYNQLYQQYYEIEEQRQIILQKMHNLNNGYNPYSGEALASDLQWGTNAPTQEFHSIAHMPGGATADSCCPCACQRMKASCSSDACPSGAGVGPIPAVSPATEKVGEKASVDVDIVKTALGAAERALSMYKDNTSDSKEDNRICSIAEQSTGAETDLSTVLNAWYSAGFYTGKYLAEKSLSKKQQN